MTSFGLIGPDEPRYAAIGREMAASGDWVTPRLWGEAWFEKPALLYWMIGAGFRAGWGDDLAPRLPVALLSAAFLVFYFLWLRREFNPFVGAVSTCLLATSGMWLAYSHAAVTDIPLAATFAAAVLLLVPATEGRRAPVVAAAALLACSFLAKGLVPLVLVLPFLWYTRRHWRLWVRPAPILVFAAIALPWYALCTYRNGLPFLEVFFWQHQFGRFTSGALQHVQPIWFYLPWLFAAFFPSVLLLPFAFPKAVYHDRRRQFMLAVVLFGIVFFSISRNKLPGYILPLLPLVAVLIASGLDGARDRWLRPMALLTAGSLFLLPLLVAAGGLLPPALASGVRGLYPLDLTTAGRVALAVPVVSVAAIASLVMRRERALILWFALAGAAWVYVEYAALPWVDRAASARSIWRELPDVRDHSCVGAVNRAWRYGLNFYSGSPLPDCAGGPPGRTAILPGPAPSGRPVIRQ